ncbi:MAG: bifunctional oligoribonuclease/PAP phosphatase NrnA [Leptospirales bacterium]
MGKNEKEVVQISTQLTKQLLKNYKPSAAVLSDIKKVILKHDKFLLTTHTGADPDGLGSEIGLLHLFKLLKKKAIIVNNERVPESMAFIASGVNIYNIDEHREELEKKNLKDYLVLIIDSSEIRRSEKVVNFFQSKELDYLTIDHHPMPKNIRYMVDTSYAATAELVWDLYHYLNIDIPKKAAIPLYTGISADSGNFRYSKTSFRTHLAAGELIGFGISTDKIYRSIFEFFPFDRLEFTRRIMNKAVFNKEIGYSVACARQSMFKGLKLGDSPTEGLVNQFLAVEGVEISAFITETPEKDLKCSLRSVGDVNVSEIAQKFGGGGHRNAAGLFQKGPFASGVAKIIAEIENCLKNQS